MADFLLVLYQKDYFSSDRRTKTPSEWKSCTRHPVKKIKCPWVVNGKRLSFPKTKTCAFCHYVLPILNFVEIPVKQNAG